MDDSGAEIDFERLRGWQARRAGLPDDRDASAAWREGWKMRDELEKMRKDNCR